MKPYTRAGDDGKSYVKGRRLDKDSRIFEAIGDLDELVSLLGVVRSLTELPEVDEVLKGVQEGLFRLNSHLAGFKDDFGEEELRWVEGELEKFGSKLSEPRKFVLPGGPISASLLHLSRAVCRRAERHIISLSKEWEMDKWVVPYINRLSSLLFVLARYEAAKSGTKEEFVDLT